MPITVTCDESSESDPLNDDAVGKPKSVPLRKTKVPMGIELVYFGFLLLILVVPVAFCARMFPQGNAQQTTMFLFGLSLVSFSATIVITVGKLMCLTAPPEMSGKGALNFAVVIDVLSLLFTVANMIKVVPVLPSVLSWVINLLSVVGVFCFVVFLQNLGDLLGERVIRERGSGVLHWGIRVVVLWLLLIGLQMFGFAIANAISNADALPLVIVVMTGMLFGILLLVVGTIAVIRYVGLLATCRYALSKC